MHTIKMFSSVTKVKVQGVSSAYTEQVNLVQNGPKDDYNVSIDKFKVTDITHYHTIDSQYFLVASFMKFFGTTVAYVIDLWEKFYEGIAKHTNRLYRSSVNEK